ncbi:MAG: carboxy-S-adenosyl-L-methionine synthase CmoA [Methylococcaceae bacterium]|jgi:tRNA (cmo5U34)-methyltransferase
MGIGLKMQQDQIFQNLEVTEDFIFDARVAAVFDDMVSRSVPFYAEIQRLQADLIVSFLPPQGAVVCDLGCSTGTTIGQVLIHADCPASATFIGFDNSEPMLAQAKAKLLGLSPTERFTLELADLSELPELPRCHAVILNWTLQFVRPIEREALLKTIYAALNPGGVILLSEKILSHDAGLNRLFIAQYLDFKKSHSGYSDAENQRKREALENVLVPYRLDENYLLLERAGFNRIETYFRWLNFACLIAIK